MAQQVQRLKRGDQLSGIPGDTWNAFCDLVEAQQDGALLGISGRGAYRSAGTVLVKNDTGSAIDEGEIFGIDDFELDQQDQIVASGIAPLAASHWHGTFAVAVTPSANGGISRCIIHGICRAVVNVTNTGIVTADIVNADTTTLQSHLAGRARLLIPATSTGSQNAWVLLGGPRQLTYTGVAGSGITAGSSGTVTIDGFTSVTVTAHLDKMHSSEDISASKQVGVTWFDYEQKWRVMNAECEA